LAGGLELSTEGTRNESAVSVHSHTKRALLGGVGACGLIVALTAGSSSAIAQYQPLYRSYYAPGYEPVSISRSHAKSSKTKAAGKGKEEAVSKEPFGNIPKGPLQIFVSIDQQQLHLYSDGQHVTDATIATGVPGHPTPMGVFSIIQKDRFHHSNIYSNAPMPFMQRITWSGVALHEGQNLGHPASHGCIRMPHDFAAKLWVLTKLGVRVVIARSELRPADIQDSHLFVHKNTTAAAAADPVKTAQAIDSTKATDAVDPSMAGAPRSDTPAAAAPSGDTPAPIAPAVDVKAEAAPAVSAEPDPALIDVAKTVADGVASGTDAAVKVAPVAEDVPSTTGAVVQAPAAPQVRPEPKPEPPAMAQATPPAPLQTEPPAAAQAPVTAPAVAPDAGTPEAVPVPAPKPAAIAKVDTAPIAIFVSRKEKKIFVRQHFTPLFEAAITIDRPEQPLGTHVFTAMDSLGDSGAFRWNVVSLPADQAKAVKKVEYDKRGRRREDTLVAPAAPPPQTAAEVLARIDIPQDIVDRISELMSAGSSLVVSDQGLGGETGEGTDFIVVTH
jgi:L,D-transpeptidase catalytic domain